MAFDQLATIAEDVYREIDASIRKHGDQRHVPFGTGPREWLSLSDRALQYRDLADELRDTTERHAGRGEVTWADILLEEVGEALAEEDLVKLRAEVIQVAAVAFKIIDAIDARPTS